MAILDSTVEQDDGMIHHEVLEVDKFGNTPNDKEFKCPSLHSIELIVKNAENLEVGTHTHTHTQKVYRQQPMTHCIFKDIVAHKSFLYIVDSKWYLYGWKFFL